MPHVQHVHILVCIDSDAQLTFTSITTNLSEQNEVIRLEVICLLRIYHQLNTIAPIALIITPQMTILFWSLACETHLLC